MHFKLLHSNRLFLVNAVVDYDNRMIKAGWMWADVYIQNVVEELVSPDMLGATFKVKVPDSLIRLQAPTSLGFKDDTVDFDLA